jgi:lipopolysaccharide export system protein LptA
MRVPIEKEKWKMISLFGNNTPLSPLSRGETGDPLPGRGVGVGQNITQNHAHDRLNSIFQPIKTSLALSRTCFMLFACCITIMPTQWAKAQNQVQIIRADSIVGGTLQGQPVQKILGNVHLRTDSVDMYADRAYKFSNSELIEAFGNVEIDTQEEIIWADSLTYYTDIDFSELRGRVIIESDSSTLFGNSVDYRFTNKVAHFRDQIRLEDQQGTLIANTGFYFRRADSATFQGQVQLRDSLQYIEGDSLFSNRSRGYYELHGRVFADDPENSSILKGNYLEADSTGRRLLTGNAWLKNYKQDTTASDTSANDSLRNTLSDSASLAQPRADTLQISAPDSARITPDSTQTSKSEPDDTSRPDTTHIRAARILSLQNRTAVDTSTTIKSYENVRIWSPDFSSVSDSARYKSNRQTFELWSDAKAWHDQIQLTGPYIWVQLEDGDIKQLISYPSPFSVQQDTVINRLNQIKGDTLEATFRESQLQLIQVMGRSRLLRFTKKDNQPDGLLDLRAPATNIYFEGGELAELKSLGKREAINGNYLPESEGIADRTLDGFSWDPEMRPRRPAEKMQRRLPPIPEDPPFELPKRYLDHIKQTSTEPAAPPDSLNNN